MVQMKDQDKTPGKELNDMETSNLRDKRFKTRVIKMLHERGRIDELRQSFSKETETTKKNQSETKNTVSDMKNTLEEINRLFDTAK